MAEKNDLCPICNSFTLIEKEGKDELEYKGVKQTISGYTALECPNCKESFLDKKDLKKFEHLTSSFITRVKSRKKISKYVYINA